MITISFYGVPKWQQQLLIEIIEEKYTFKIADDYKDSDYLFVGPCSNYYLIPYNNKQVRIFHTCEPCFPAFGIVDYAIGYDYLNVLGKNNIERYMRYPYSLLYLYSFVNKQNHLNGMSKEEATNILLRKEAFCSFLYSHKSPGGEREAIFYALSKYKKVNSAGTFLNNMGEVIIDRNHWPEKISFLTKHKFSICYESTSRVGFQTEKICHAFLADSIPIYFGDPLIANVFNPKAFINANDFGSLEVLISHIKTIDQNDDLYCKMLTEPKLCDYKMIESQYNAFKAFLWSIFETIPEDAIQRDVLFVESTNQKELEHIFKYYKLMKNSMFAPRLIMRLIKYLKSIIHRK